MGYPWWKWKLVSINLFVLDRTTCVPNFMKIGSSKSTIYRNHQLGALFYLEGVDFVINTFIFNHVPANLKTWRSLTKFQRIQRIGLAILWIDASVMGFLTWASILSKFGTHQLLRTWRMTDDASILATVSYDFSRRAYDFSEIDARKSDTSCLRQHFGWPRLTLGRARLCLSSGLT